MVTLILTPFVPEQDSRANRLASFMRGAGVTCEIAGVSSQSIRRSRIGPLGQLARAWAPIRERCIRYSRTWTALRTRGAHVDQVLAVNCEVGLVAWAYRATHLARYRLVLDVYDHHGDIFQSRPLSFLFSVIELLAALLAGQVVLPIRERLEQYPKWSRDTIGSKALFISNAGFQLPQVSRALPEQQSRQAKRLRVVYCGNVDHSRGFDVLLAAVSTMARPIDLTIHGGGVALAELSRRHASDNIRFLGPFRNADLVELASDHDLFWAAYDLDVANNRYCDPNKFRDHVIVDMPILTNPGHPLAEMVDRSGSGFIVPLETPAIIQFLTALRAEEIDARRPSRVGAESVLSSVIEANAQAGHVLTLGLQ